MQITIVASLNSEESAALFRLLANTSEAQFKDIGVSKADSDLFYKMYQDTTKAGVNL